MGKKSRKKREDRILERKTLSTKQTPFLVNFILVVLFLTLFAPLIINGKFYFPFVGLKSLYFMGGVEIIFFAWLILILNHKRYRPKLNSIAIALTLFLIVLILSSILGVDFSRSFWSKFERMTGLLMWLHLFAFFLVLSSTFRRASDWNKIFTVSIFAAIIISTMALLEIAGVESFKFSQKAGATLGNTSFLGTYLLFNAFLAIWLFFQKSPEGEQAPYGVKNWGWRIYSVIGVVLMVPAIYLSDARAATISFLGGLGLLFLLWLAFYPRSKKIRIFGKVLLISGILIVSTTIILLYIPGSPVQQKFIDLTSRARVVNWEMAQKGFLERPLLGWGPENYTLTFTKFFNPCLFISECGGEIWFDRTHNIVLDTLVTKGAFGFLAYLGLFGSLFYVLWRNYKKKKIDFWTFGIFIVIPTSYFIQNLTVFDMVSSLMMFLLILGFGGFLANIGRHPSATREKEIKESFTSKYQWLKGILIFIFCFTFLGFIIQPARTDYLVIKSLRTTPSSKLIENISKENPEQLDNLFEASSQKRIELYKKTLETSPMGKYQIIEFFAQQSQSIITRNIKQIPEDTIKKELDFLTGILKESEKESPLDYRIILRLGYLYNIYYLFDQTKLSLTEKYGERAITLSPRNQQGYWSLSQTKLYQRDFEAALDLAQQAVDLEPRHLQSHKIAVQIAQLSGDSARVKEIAQKAVEINPDWEEEFKDIL